MDDICPCEEMYMDAHKRRIVSNWKHSKCPSTGGRIKKMRSMRINEILFGNKKEWTTKQIIVTFGQTSKTSHYALHHSLAKKFSDKAHLQKRQIGQRWLRSGSGG